MDNTSNPWTIDAADVVASDLEVWVGEAHIYQVEFQDYTSDADTCTVNQNNGKIFWFGNGAADLQTVRSGNAGFANGITIPMGGITNGSVRIYHM